MLLRRLELDFRACLLMHGNEFRGLYVKTSGRPEQELRRCSMLVLAVASCERKEQDGMAKVVAGALRLGGTSKELTWGSDTSGMRRFIEAICASSALRC